MRSADDIKLNWNQSKTERLCISSKGHIRAAALNKTTYKRDKRTHSLMFGPEISAEKQQINKSFSQFKVSLHLTCLTFVEVAAIHANTRSFAIIQDPRPASKGDVWDHS